MGGLKKGKGGGGKGRGKIPKGEGRREVKKPSHDDTQKGDLLLPLQERVAAVKPFWETLSQEERVKLLTVSLEDLQQRAADLAERHRRQAAAEDQLYPGETLAFDLEPSIEEVLQLGIGRLHEKPTWKLWQWLPDEKEFLDADSFRHYMENEHIEEGLRMLLPKEEGKPVEKPYEAAFRLRMSELLQRVHQHNRQLQEEPVSGSRRARAARATPDQIGAAMRDSNIELINIMMEALEQEHEFLYHAVLFPITSCICELLEEGQRESTCMDLCYEDLEKLHPDEVARICEWVTEKVDGFSSKIKPEAKDVEEEDEEEEGIGDVDLFSLSANQTQLLVNAKWLQHLQERVLGDDGQPRKMRDGEDPYQMGLVLEWVFGTIVSTAEKARDGAKRALGTRPPTATQAHDQLMHALHEQQSWERRAKDAKELLNRMLKSRKDVADIGQKFDIRPAPSRPLPGAEGYVEPAELPDHVIIAMLQREVLLTEAKLHALDYELVMAERKLRQLRSQLRQGEPEFERLKRELEEVKNQPRGLEGTFRSAAEMERHRAQMADAAIEEQLEVQTAFREHGARLQGIYDKRQRTEMEVARKEQEIKQLKGWRTTVQSLIDRFEEQTAAAALVGDSADPSNEETAPDEATAAHHQALEAASRSLTAQDIQLSKLRSHFQKDVRRQLYGDDDDRTFFDWIRAELRAVEKKLEDGRAVLHHLEMFLVNVACNDPGAAIGANLVLPLLQDRLDAKALEYAAQRAAAAEEAIIKMEEEKAERAKQERERRQKVKQKAKDKVRTEKERLLAEQDAKRQAEQAVQEESKRALVEKEELLRKQKQEEMEKRRQAEEDEMEARRKELLSEEDGYWRLRMVQAAQQQALHEEAIVKPSEAEEDPSASSASDQTTWKDDNDGFQDTARGPRKNKSLKVSRKPEAEPQIEHLANGHVRANGRPEDSRAPQRAPREGEVGFRENGGPRERRPSLHEGRTLPLREVRPIRNLPSPSLEKPRSGRASPQLGTEGASKQPPATLPLRQRSFTASDRSRPSSAGHSAKQAVPKAPSETGSKPPQSAGDGPHADSSWEAKDESAASLGKASAASHQAPASEPAIREQASGDARSAAPAMLSDAESQLYPEAPKQEASAAAAQPAQEVQKVLPETSQATAEDSKPEAAQAAALPDRSLQSQELQAGRPEPSAAHVEHGAAEMAPGTPAQQVPPLPMLLPTPSAQESMPHQSSGAVIFMQNSHIPPSQRNSVPRMIPPHGQMRPPPLLEAGYPRPINVRREGGPMPPFAVQPPPHLPQTQSLQNGPIPGQLRRPQIGPPRMPQEPGMLPQAFQRSFRGHPVPASSGHFPGPPTAAPVHLPAAESGEMGAAHPAMLMQPYPATAGQPASNPQATGPPVMYPGPPSHPKALATQPMMGSQHEPGTQPLPQHVFVGNMVTPPFSMMPGSQMPLVNGSPGPMQHTSGSLPPMLVHANGSPRDYPMAVRPAYGQSSPPQTAPVLQRSAGSTPLRASAPSFVPGGFRPPQQGLLKRPSSDTRGNSDDRSAQFTSHMSRRSSSDALSTPSRSASDAPGLPSAGAREMVPSLIQQPTPVQPHQDPPSEPKEAGLVRGTPPAPPTVSRSSSENSPVASSPSQPEATPTRQDAAATSSFQSDAQAGPIRPVAAAMAPQSPKADFSPESASQPGTAKSSQGSQQPKWSTVAAMDRQAAHGQAGPSSAPIKKSSSAEALRSSAGSRDGKRPLQNQAQSHGMRQSGSNNKLDSRHPGGSRTAGDKRKITRAGGVTWEGLQGDLHRLKLVRGLSNEAGRNNCFLNVIIQSLWHLRSFREALLKMQPQTLEAQGAPAEDLRVLRALLNIFNAFDQPREELPSSDGTDASSQQNSGSVNGEEADAKRAKREGQEDAAAAKVANGWTVSPAELREALSIVSRNALRFDLTDMHDAAEVLDRIFGSLQRAEVGDLQEGEPDAALPQRVKVTQSGAQPHSSSLAKRRPFGLVESLFGLDVQVPGPSEDDDEESQTVKRSKGTGGAVVGRWQETPSRPSRSQGGSPKAPKPAAKKAKDPSVIEMLQFVKLYHLVPAQGLKVAYDHLIGSSFEEVLKEADVAEVLAQNANGGGASLNSRAVKTSDIILLKRPRIFNLAIGWESAQAPADVINATIDALSPQVDPAGVFKSAPSGPPYQLRCIVCYFGHHYKSYALSEELDEWLLFDDTTISHVGAWRDVAASLRGSRLQPNLLFYEQSAGAG